MSLPATDNFTGTNGDDLNARTGWAVNTGAFQINTNGLCANNAGARSLGRWTSDAFAADQYAQILISALGVEGAEVGPAVRVDTGGAATGYGLTCDVTGSDTLSKLVAGTFTQIGSAVTGWATTQTMRLEVSGTTLTRKRNGATVGTPQTDSSIASGAAGVRGDDAFTTTRVDDWQADNLGSAPVGFYGTKRQAGAAGPRDRLGFLLQRAWDYTLVAPATFDAALMAAMDRPRPDLVFDLPSVVAAGMTPPDNIIP